MFRFSANEQCFAHVQFKMCVVCLLNTEMRNVALFIAVRDIDPQWINAAVGDASK